MTTSTQIPLGERGAYKIKEAAVYLGGISVSQVRRYIRRRLITRLPAIRPQLSVFGSCSVRASISCDDLNSELDFHKMHGSRQ
jgi:hypothetical protein